MTAVVRMSKCKSEKELVASGRLKTTRKEKKEKSTTSDSALQ